MNNVNDLRDIEKIYTPQESGYADIKRGDIFYINKASYSGSEQAAGRPGVIVGNDIGNEKSPVALVVYLTTSRKPSMPTHVTVECKEHSTVMCEQVMTVDKARIGDFIKHVTNDEMERIDKALEISLALHPEQSSFETNGDKLLERAKDVVQSITETAERINGINKVLEEVKENYVLGFLGETIVHIDTAVSPETLEMIKNAALGKISEEQSAMCGKLAKMLIVEETKQGVPLEEKADAAKIKAVKKKTMLSDSDEADVRKLYCEERKTAKYIADRYEIQPSSVYNYMKRKGIVRRPAPGDPEEP